MCILHDNIHKREREREREQERATVAGWVRDLVDRWEKGISGKGKE